IQSVHAVAIPQNGRSHVLWDNVSINLGCTNGSIATIVYTSIGDTEVPKEHIEVFCGGKVGIIRDFKEAELWSRGKKSRLRWSSQDKGQKRQVEAWVKSLREGATLIPFDQIVNVHKACLAAIDSM